MSFYEEIASNKRKTILLFAVFFLLIFVLGYAISFVLGNVYFYLPFFVIISIIYFLISYFAGHKMILAISRAKKADPEKYYVLHNVVEEMSIAAGIPKPQVYVIEDDAMNAFASGRNPQHSVVCVTTALLEKMSRAELQGVIAHEISHIKNYDIRVMMLASVLVSMAVLISDFFIRMIWYGGFRHRHRSAHLTIIILVIAIIGAIITPIVAQLIRMAISRSREYLADASAAKITRYPAGLASALEKLKADTAVLEVANKATAHLYISNPLKTQKLWLKNLFSTHPPIDKRIKKLKAL